MDKAKLKAKYPDLIFAYATYAGGHNYAIDDLLDDANLMSIIWGIDELEIDFTEEGVRFIKNEYGVQNLAELILKNGGLNKLNTIEEALSYVNEILTPDSFGNRLQQIDMIEKEMESVKQQIQLQSLEEKYASINEILVEINPCELTNSETSSYYPCLPTVIGFCSQWNQTDCEMNLSGKIPKLMNSKINEDKLKELIEQVIKLLQT